VRVIALKWNQQTLTTIAPARLRLLTGQQIFIAKADPAATGASPQMPYMGLDHFGLTVENIDAAVAELKGKGVAFTMEPKTIRPGVRIAFLTAPQNVSIELIQRG
jgi:lactoylglutathione lyase